jgi:hypothetical protein
MIASDGEAALRARGPNIEKSAFERQWQVRPQPCGDRDEPAKRGDALTWAS